MSFRRLLHVQYQILLVHIIRTEPTKENYQQDFGSESVKAQQMSGYRGLISNFS